MIKKLCFENGQGKLDMFLSGNGPVRITSVSGLGNPEKSYSTVTFAGKSGQKTLSCVSQPRTIVIGGDVKISGREDAERILKILHDPGMLKLDSEGKQRKIFCNQVDMTVVARNRGFMKFALTLVSDSAYFMDISQTDISVFERQNMLGGHIVFPCSLTEKTNQAIVQNYGEVDVEPVIAVYTVKDEENEVTGEIEIENKTTGQKVTIVTGTEKNEIITIDIENRKVVSSVRGNITHLISDDTFLNRFWLVPGENLLHARHTNVGEDISVVCSYYSNYREGIY